MPTRKTVYTGIYKIFLFADQKTRKVNKANKENNL